MLAILARRRHQTHPAAPRLQGNPRSRRRTGLSDTTISTLLARPSLHSSIAAPQFWSGTPVELGRVRQARAVQPVRVEVDDDRVPLLNECDRSADIRFWGDVPDHKADRAA